MSTRRRKTRHDLEMRRRTVGQACSDRHEGLGRAHFGRVDNIVLVSIIKRVPRWNRLRVAVVVRRHVLCRLETNQDERVHLQPFKGTLKDRVVEPSQLGSTLEPRIVTQTCQPHRRWRVRPVSVSFWLRANLATRSPSCCTTSTIHFPTHPTRSAIISSQGLDKSTTVIHHVDATTRRSIQDPSLPSDPPARAQLSYDRNHAYKPASARQDCTYRRLLRPCRAWSPGGCNSQA
jgi:hypothetical protein